jgi:hypothetical protein
LEGAVTTPARKAAAFSAGVQSAVSNFMKRDKSGETASGAAAGWSYEDVSAERPGEASVATPAGEAAADAAEAVGDAAATAAAGATGTATAAGEAATDAAAAAGEAVADAADAHPDGA